MASEPGKRFTPDEYLELERASSTKSEYFDGQIFAMGGASPIAKFLVFTARRHPRAARSTPGVRWDETPARGQFLALRAS
jgi:Uma2 family endonuclease